MHPSCSSTQVLAIWNNKECSCRKRMTYQHSSVLPSSLTVSLTCEWLLGGPHGALQQQMVTCAVVITETAAMQALRTNTAHAWMLIKVHTKRIHLDVIRQSRVNKEADLKKVKPNHGRCWCCCCLNWFSSCLPKHSQVKIKTMNQTINHQEAKMFQTPTWHIFWRQGSRTRGARTREERTRGKQGSRLLRHIFWRSQEA